MTDRKNVRASPCYSNYTLSQKLVVTYDASATPGDRHSFTQNYPAKENSSKRVIHPCAKLSLWELVLQPKKSANVYPVAPLFFGIFKGSSCMIKNVDITLSERIDL